MLNTQRFTFYMHFSWKQFVFSSGWHEMFPRTFPFDKYITVKIPHIILMFNKRQTFLFHNLSFRITNARVLRFWCYYVLLCLIKHILWKDSTRWARMTKTLLEIQTPLLTVETITSDVNILCEQWYFRNFRPGVARIRARISPGLTENTPCWGTAVGTFKHPNSLLYIFN